MPGYLTTHVLDTARGCPAAGLKIDLYRIEGETRVHLHSMATNDDGRTDSPILPDGEFAHGVYELAFHAGAYLDATGAKTSEPRFLDMIPIRFGRRHPLSRAAAPVAVRLFDLQDTHYHVPLLLSPFGYSTYRGS